MHNEPEEAHEQAEIIQLYDETSDELRRLLRGKLGNAQEADEVAQDAYLRLYQNNRRKEIRDPRKYLFTTALRLALNVLRRRRTETNYLSARKSSVEPERSGADEASAYRILTARQQLDAVKDALSRLPDKTRYIFLLSRYEGLTYPEIADRLGISVKAVEYHMKRALEKVLVAFNECE